MCNKHESIWKGWGIMGPLIVFKLGVGILALGYTGYRIYLWLVG